jgi:hypothetical protein
MPYSRQNQPEKLINQSQNCSVIFLYIPPTTNKLRTIFKQHQLQLIPKSDRKLKSQVPATKDKTTETRNLEFIRSVVERKTALKIHWTNSEDTNHTFC